MRSERMAVLLLGMMAGLRMAAGQTPEGQLKPRVTQGKLETRAAGNSLEAGFRSIVKAAAAPEWIAYAVPQIPGDRQLCCWNDGDWNGHGPGCGSCKLEKHDGGNNSTSEGDRTVRLEGARNLLVLFRAEKGQVGKIRVVSEDCELDAGGLTFVWLTGVKPAESVALLATFVGNWAGDTREERQTQDAALMAIAMHAAEAADRALESFAAADRPEKLREQTAFWLGAARGAAGLPLLERMAKNDPSPHVRGQVAFALSVSKEPGAVEEMIRMARSDANGYVRGQALFWLAQKAGKKAVGAISGAIENDPDTDVKKKAVFALSQLPKEEGVPKLIEVARTNRNPAVRKQAMFWLGQSNDPRALAFFEQVLAK